MADDNLFGAGSPDEQPRNDKRGAEDGGLGNLPPLSDFDSGGGFDAEAELPPLGNFETQDHGAGAFGGLPPLGDLHVETPDPAGGNIKPTPVGFGGGDIASSFGAGRGGTGFQDLAADSDFSPETPDIGPGPEASLDTPIFDSAFGPADSGFSFGSQTPAPTQAMETPVFNEPDFGGDALGGGVGAFGAAPGGGTPIPDFGPDTGFGGGDLGFGAPPAIGAAIGAASGGPSATPSGKAPAPKKGGVSTMVVCILVLVFTGAGIGVRPYLEDYIGGILPNPMAEELTKLESQNQQLNTQINQLRSVGNENEKVQISPEEVNRLQQEIVSKTQQLEQLNGNVNAVDATLKEKNGQLSSLEQQIAEKNEEFANAQAVYDDLRNETAIIQARQRGLVAEVDRLTGLVGQLDEANARRIATKEAFEHNIDRLLIQVKESLPLTPQKYAHQERLNAVQSLQEKSAASKYVSADLQEEYTGLYLRELEIARSNEYFFANITVTDEYGTKIQKWAECLMRGNWGVYYRTLDGKNVGVFENMGTSDTPKWGYREGLPLESAKGIESTVIASRVADYQTKVKALAERELAAKNSTDWQTNFDSL